MSSESERPAVRFEPLRPASRGQLVAALMLGPVVWLVALIVGAWIFDYTEAIARGLSITVASFLLSLVVLALVHAARRRQERRFADGR